MGKNRGMISLDHAEALHKDDHRLIGASSGTAIAPSCADMPTGPFVNPPDARSAFRANVATPREVHNYLIQLKLPG